MVNRPVRVCYLIDRLRPAGTELQLLLLIRHMNQDAILPWLCLLDGEDEVSRSLEPPGCPIIRLGLRSLRSQRALVQGRRLARLLRRERIDVLQTYFQDSTYFGTLVGRLAGVPWIVRVRNNLGYWMTPMHRRLAWITNRLIDATFTNSRAGQTQLLRDERLDPARVFVIENGIELSRFDCGRSPSRSNGRGPRKVGVVANLRPVKGLDVFLRAGAIIQQRYPDVEFHLAGEGESRAELQKLTLELDLQERVHFRGMVADVPTFLGELAVAVLPSHSESLSNALLEYMAAGKPLVATRVGAATELIDNAVHGLLVPPGEPQALATAVLRLLDEPGLADKLARAARRAVEVRYSIPAMLQRFENVYRALLPAGSAKRRGQPTSTDAAGDEPRVLASTYPGRDSTWNGF